MFHLVCYTVATLTLIYAGLYAIALLRLDVDPYLNDPASDDDPITITDFYFRDDRGNVYVVTAATVSEAVDLLRTDHDLPNSYIHNHVFLTSTQNAIV